MGHVVRKFISKARATKAPSMKPPRRTIGEERAWAGVPRAAFWFLAIFQQMLFAVGYLALFLCYPYDDPLYFSCASWRLPLLLSMYAYTSLVLLVMSHVELFLPRAPLVAYQWLEYGGFLAVCGGVINPVGCFALGLRDLPVGVVAGCTCFFAALVAGLLVLWMWLVRQYGAAVPQPQARGVRLFTTSACAC